MSTDIFLKDHIRDLMQASKTNTNTKLNAFNDAVIDMFKQVNDNLTDFDTRLKAIESLLKALRIYIDADGNLAQSDEI